MLTIPDKNSMKWLLFFSLLHVNSYAQNDKAKIKLLVGETHASQIYPIKITLESFHTSKTECAVPGFNCGSGYTPEPVTTPIIEFKLTDHECTKSPRPKKCEWNFNITKTDKKTFVEVEILNIFDFCMREENQSNRNSCILRTTVGNHFNPMYAPENCNRVDDPLVKNSCFEMMAENLKSPQLCENVKKPFGRRCVLMVAVAAKNAEICQELKTAPLNQSEEQDRQRYLDECLEKTKK